MEYKENVDGVGRGDQHRTVGSGFANVAHFQKYYKKYFLGISYISLLQAFTTCNMSVDGFREIGRGGVLIFNKMAKWEFYSAVSEELLAQFL